MRVLVRERHLTSVFACVTFHVHSGGCNRAYHLLWEAASRKGLPETGRAGLRGGPTEWFALPVFPVSVVVVCLWTGTGVPLGRADKGLASMGAWDAVSLPSSLLPVLGGLTGRALTDSNFAEPTKQPSICIFLNCFPSWPQRRWNLWPPLGSEDPWRMPTTVPFLRLLYHLCVSPQPSKVGDVTPFCPWEHCGSEMYSLTKPCPALVPGWSCSLFPCPVQEGEHVSATLSSEKLSSVSSLLNSTF